jgi:hypothetical protein
VERLGLAWIDCRESGVNQYLERDAGQADTMDATKNRFHSSGCAASYEISTIRVTQKRTLSFRLIKRYHIEIITIRLSTKVVNWVSVSVLAYKKIPQSLFRRIEFVTTCNKCK